LVVPDVSVKLMVGFDRAFTVTEVDAEAEHAVLELVTVTSYDVVKEGDTTLLFPAALIGAPHK
jgi:hypothetical protein